MSEEQQEIKIKSEFHPTGKRKQDFDEAYLDISVTASKRTSKPSRKMRKLNICVANVKKSRHFFPKAILLLYSYLKLIIMPKKVGTNFRFVVILR
jgi:hypothetical protein